MDGPSLGELARRIADLTTLITGLVTRTEYAADRRFDERRFTEQEADMKALAEELKALRISLETARDKRGGNLRQAIYNGILPAIFVLITVAVTIWTSRG